MWRTPDPDTSGNRYAKPDPDPVLITAYVPDIRPDTDFLCLFHPYTWQAAFDIGDVFQAFSTMGKKISHKFVWILALFKSKPRAAKAALGIFASQFERNDYWLFKVFPSNPSFVQNNIWEASELFLIIGCNRWSENCQGSVCKVGLNSSSLGRFLESPLWAA